VARKVVENGGVSGYYALAVMGGVLLLAAASLREKPAPKRKPRKARNRLGKVQKAVTAKRKRVIRSNTRKPDVSALQAKHEELEGRLRKLRAAHRGD
jgi:hypothetical protein